MFPQLKHANDAANQAHDTLTALRRAVTSPRADNGSACAQEGCNRRVGGHLEPGLAEHALLQVRAPAAAPGQDWRLEGARQMLTPCVSKRIVSCAPVEPANMCYTGRNKSQTLL